MNRGVSKYTASCVLAALALGACKVGTSPGIPDFDTGAAEPQVAERLRALREVVAVHPDSGPAWGLLALSLQAHDYPEAAVESYAAARSRRPGTFVYLYLPAILLADRGHQDASQLFEQARTLRPDYVPLRLREAAWELDLGRPDRALELLEDSMVLAIFPARARLVMARAFLAQNELDRARALLKVALQAAPRYPELHALSAQVYRRSGHADQAELAEQRARTFKEEPALADPVLAILYAEGISSGWYILRGQAYLIAGRPDDARFAFEQAVAARPTDAHSWNQLGTALQALGRFEEAVESHRRALELRPEFANAAINLAMSLFRNGEFEAGVDAARLAIENDSTAAQAYLYLGMFEHALGRPGRARKVYALGLARTPFDVRIGIRLSWILATSRQSSFRDGRRAVVLSETVNEIEGYDQPASLDALAAAYAEYGAYDRAVLAAGRARELAVQHADTILAAAIAQRTSLYRRGAAYRE